LLAQGRSRDTRQAIIKAALELWSERGYDTGIDDTTAEEIAVRAGVAKATFYLHFARKDDILLETGWLTAKVFYEDALKALLEGGPAEQVIDAITVKLCRRVERVPRLALQRMLRAQGAAGPRTIDDPDRFGFRRAFAVILLHAQQGGDLPRTVSPDSLGRMFEAQLMAVIRDWALDEDDTELLATLRERFAILLAGARNLPEDASWPGGRARRARGGPRPARTPAHAGDAVRERSHVPCRFADLPARGGQPARSPAGPPAAACRALPEAAPGGARAEHGGGGAVRGRLARRPGTGRVGSQRAHRGSRRLPAAAHPRGQRSRPGHRAGVAGAPRALPAGHRDLGRLV